MKKLLILPLFLLLLACENDFRYDYQTIDDDMLRVIDFSYEKTELSPGDTATLYATFAGYTDAIDLNSVEWRASWNIVTNPVGPNVVVDDTALTVLSQEIVDSTALTKVFKITFQIPDSIMYHSGGIPENWGDIFKYIDKSINPGTLGLPVTKTGMLQLIEAVRDKPELIEDGLISSEAINAISQLFTVEFKIEALPQKGDKILDAYGRKVYHSVRFNRWFEHVPGVMKNRAPLFDSLLIYELQKGTVVNDDCSFNPAAILARHRVINDTITLPRNSDNEFLLMIYPVERDVTMSLEQALLSIQNKTTANLGSEFYSLSYFDRTVEGDFPLGKQLEGESNLITTYGYKVSPNKKGTFAPSTYWFRIDDEDDDVPHRPRGSAWQEVTIVSQ